MESSNYGGVTVYIYRLRSLQPQVRGVFKCLHPRCEIDEVLGIGDTFADILGNTFIINHHLSCNSRNVVYLLTCNCCGKQYVGSTTTRFRDRFNQYKSNINLYGLGRRDFRQEELIVHFYSEGHNGSYKDINVKIIDYCDPNDPEDRENFWIDKLGTMHPQGLNIKQIKTK